MDLPLSTFSIVACDRDAGEVGIAVASKFLAVGAVVPWARAGVGAIATQSHANTTFGPDGLRMLENGLDADRVLASLIEADSGQAQRQVGLVASRGGAATYTGSECNEWAGGVASTDYAIQGNILTGPEVVSGMREVFESARANLADRLLASLKAGEAAGGDSRGRQSAAVLVVREGGGYSGFNDRYIDLRVDDHPDPVQELMRIRDIHRLYFDRPTLDDALPMTTEVQDDVLRILHRSGELKASAAQSFGATERKSLERLYGRENLEERWRDDDTIDRVALEYLRSKYSS